MESFTGPLSGSPKRKSEKEQKDIKQFPLVEDSDDSLVVIGSPSPFEENDSDLEEAIVAMNGSHFYVDEWTKLFCTPGDLCNLKIRALKGGLRSCRFRSICWKIFLRCLPDEKTQWIKETGKLREHYKDLKDQVLVNPRVDSVALDPLLNNPLSQEEASPWNRFFLDSELKLTIQQDVVRTFPEIEFFQTKQVRELMVNILFCYAREHPEMSYRQGMHELLAPVIFVLHSDQQAFLHASEIEFLDMFEIKAREDVVFLLNPDYLEHDAYFMFQAIMETVKIWYIIKDIVPSKMETICKVPFSKEQDAHSLNDLIIELSYINDSILKRHDIELYNYLEKMEIAPQIFGIRWLRLLFGREFPLQDLLVLWDAIFADSSTFGLVDYIFVSMLIYVRELLLNGDYATSLTHLMRYPAVTDVHYIIDLALHLREPWKYAKPTGYTRQMLQHAPTVGGRNDIHRAPQKMNQSPSSSSTSSPERSTNKVVTGISTLTKKVVKRPQSLPVVPLDQKQSAAVEMQISRSPSPNLGEFVQIEQHSKSVTAPPDGQDQRGATHPPSHEVHSGTQFQALELEHMEKIPMVEEVPGGGGQSSKLRSSFKKRNRISEEVARQEISYLQGQINDLQEMCKYCAKKMTVHIDCLQDRMLDQNMENEDEMMIALAGIKQVRDILKGTLKYSQNIFDGDDIVISDDHYTQEENAEKELPIDYTFLNS